MRQIHLGPGVWWLESWSGPSLQFDADHEGSHELRRGPHHVSCVMMMLCHEPQSQQRLFASKRMCRSVGTRIIRLDRGYSTQCPVIWTDCGLGTQRCYLFYIIYFPSTSKEKQRLNPECHIKKILEFREILRTYTW